MKYNLLIGGSAGQGMDTLSAILEKFLHRKGYNIFTIRDYMSRVRGGHNFIQIRFGDEVINSHCEAIDLIIALDLDTINIHATNLSDIGTIICDLELKSNHNKILTVPLKNIAKESGNIKAFGSVAIGVVLKLFAIDLTDLEFTMKHFFKDEKLLKQNITAIQVGYEKVQPKYTLPKVKKCDNLLINGNEAIALGAITSNCKFYSAYPMTPSTTIMNYLADKMEEAEIVVEQAEDEIAAINMAIGSSYAGVRSMTGTSGGGFSLMVEALGLSGMMEVPLVVANVQRPGPTTGFPTRTEQSDLKFVINASQGEFPRVVMAVKDPEDAFYQTIRAFNIADKYQIPVIIMSDQYLADYTKTIPVYDLDRVIINTYITEVSDLKDKEYLRYELTNDGISKRSIPGKIKGQIINVDSDEHDERGYITESADIRIKMTDKRLKKLESLKVELIEPEFLGDEQSEILLVGWGSTYGQIKDSIEILKDKNINVQALVFGDIWPLPEKLIREKGSKAKKIINIEQNATGQLSSIIREVTGIKCNQSILKYDGRPISANEISSKIEELINSK